MIRNRRDCRSLRYSGWPHRCLGCKRSWVQILPARLNFPSSCSLFRVPCRVARRMRQETPHRPGGPRPTREELPCHGPPPPALVPRRPRYLVRLDRRRTGPPRPWRTRPARRPEGVPPAHGRSGRAGPGQGTRRRFPDGPVRAVPDLDPEAPGPGDLRPAPVPPQKLPGVREGEGRPTPPAHGRRRRGLARRPPEVAGQPPARRPGRPAGVQLGRPAQAPRRQPRLGRRTRAPDAGPPIPDGWPAGGGPGRDQGPGVPGLPGGPRRDRVPAGGDVRRRGPARRPRRRRVDARDPQDERQDRQAADGLPDPGGGRPDAPAGGREPGRPVVPEHAQKALEPERRPVPVPGRCASASRSSATSRRTRTGGRS